MEYRPKYIVDVTDLTEEERQSLKIRSGHVDPKSVYVAIFGYEPGEQQTVAITRSLDAILPGVSRCQRDLMASEFGEEETLLKDAVLSTDVFDDPGCFPYDANVKKLNEVLQKIGDTLIY